MVRNLQMAGIFCTIVSPGCGRKPRSNSEQPGRNDNEPLVPARPWGCGGVSWCSSQSGVGVGVSVGRSAIERGRDFLGRRGLGRRAVQHQGHVADVVLLARLNDGHKVGHVLGVSPISGNSSSALSFNLSARASQTGASQSIYGRWLG